MAVRLISVPATWPRLSPASSLACLAVPALISTPFRRPRRPEVAFPISLGPSAAGCACTSDITSAYLTLCYLTKMNRREAEERLSLVAAADHVVSSDAHRQCEDEDRRQDGGKKQLAHSNHL